MGGMYTYHKTALVLTAKKRTRENQSKQDRNFLIWRSDKGKVGVNCKNSCFVGLRHKGRKKRGKLEKKWQVTITLRIKKLVVSFSKKLKIKMTLLLLHTYGYTGYNQQM